MTRSDLRILFEIPDYWTREQALAVYELIDGVRDGVAAAIEAGHDPAAIEVLFSTHSIPTDDAARSGAELFADVEGGAYAAQHLAVAEHIMAETAPEITWQLVYQSRSGPPSQPYAGTKCEPATVEITPVTASMRRMRLLPVSATNRLPAASRAQPAGAWKVASAAGPPSPANP